MSFVQASSWSVFVFRLELVMISTGFFRMAHKRKSVDIEVKPQRRIPYDR